MNKTQFKTIRKSLSWSQENLAQRLGVKKLTIYRYEKGKTPVPPLVREKMLEFEKLAENLKPIEGK